MKVRFGRVLFSGASAAGKTNFYNLLLSKKFQEKHISTGLHESERVSALKISMKQSDSHVLFSVLDFKKEIDELQSRLNVFTEQSQQPTELPQIIVSEPSIFKSEKKPEFNEIDLQTKLCGVELSMAEGTVSSEKVPHIKKEDTWNILTFLDTGGQPQFISMLPAVNSCTMVTFIVHNMTNTLDSPVIVTHGNQHGERSFTPYTIGCTNLELIRSLMSFTNNILLGRRPDSIFKKECIIEGKNTSYISLIGTHSDCVAEDDIKKISNDVDKVVYSSQLSHVWEQVHKDYTYLIPVNNKTTLTDEEDQSAGVIRNKLYDALCEQNTYHVPIVWLILELEIRQICEERQNHAISFAEVVEVCREKTLLDKEDDIKNGLRFHHLFGTLLYFEEVEEMSDVIFTDLQWFFNRITDIVNVHYGLSDVKALEEFKRKGIFKPTLLDKIDFTIEGFRGISTPSRNCKESFLKLLQYLNIVAPIKQSSDNVKKYFMPCLLKSCNLPHPHCKFLETYGSMLIDGNTKVNSLLIQFKLYSESSQKIKSFPRGVFCCLVVKLLQDDSKWKLVWSPPGDDNEVFDNLVTLLLKDTGHKVTLIDRVLFLEVQVRHKNTKEPSVHYKVKNTIGEALIEVGSKLNFNKWKINFGFLCTECQDREVHMVELPTELPELPKYLTCHFGRPTEVAGAHKVWFEKVNTVIN